MFFEISIDSNGGLFVVGNFSVSWANSVDPFFDTERLEGYTSISFGDTSIEFGCIDQERPGLYLTRYAHGEIDSITPIFTI